MHRPPSVIFSRSNEQQEKQREKAGPIYLCFAPYWTNYPSGPVNLIDHEEIATKAQLLDHWEVDTIPFEGLFKTI